MEKNSPYPIGSSILLRRIDGGWQVFSAYPPGTTLSDNTMKMDRRRKNTLDAVYEFITQHHTDVSVGKAPPHPEDDKYDTSDIPLGALVVLELRADGWHPVVDYHDGGMTGRGGPLATIRDALQWLRIQFVAE